MAHTIDPKTAHKDITRLIESIETVIIGKRPVVERVVAALLSGGHVLLEDRPGLGKTMLARALAASIDLPFRRIQCTPDLLPVDITGYVDPRTNTFRSGPIFASIVLADELNRATPRTQSALLEAMAEGQVSIEGQTHALPRPFLLIATQNPLEFRGVNDLPEAQMDRFQMVLAPGYPDEEGERRILAERQTEDPLGKVTAVLDVERILALMESARAVTIKPALLEWVVTLVRKTRESSDLLMGASPRAGLTLMHLAKAIALTQGRAFVVPDDLMALAADVLAHRVIPRSAPDTGITMAEYRGQIVRRILEAVPVPKA